MIIRSALPSRFLAADPSGAVRSVASIPVEDEDGTVFAADLDRLAGVGALVEGRNVDDRKGRIPRLSDKFGL